MSWDPVLAFEVSSKYLGLPELGNSFFRTNCHSSVPRSRLVCFTRTSSSLSKKAEGFSTGPWSFKAYLLKFTGFVLVAFIPSVRQRKCGSLLIYPAGYYNQNWGQCGGSYRVATRIRYIHWICNLFGCLHNGVTFSLRKIWPNMTDKSLHMSSNVKPNLWNPLIYLAWSFINFPSSNLMWLVSCIVNGV